MNIYLEPVVLNELEMPQQLALLPIEEFTLGEIVGHWEVPDAIWSTDNELEIPMLDVNMQAKAVDLPFVGWGSISRKRRIRGTWHFYTDDYRFEGLWKKPAEIVNTYCVNCVEPNFSVYNQMPFAVAVWGTYRKRWIARWWQSRGIKIFVDLNVAEKFAKLNLIGVPKGWNAYATRGYSARLDATEREYALACEHAGKENILFVVYGGGKAVQEYCRQRGWLWFDETMTERRNKKEVING